MCEPMPRQFIIVNNGMTEMRGHYLETALSIAEAARDAGFRPFLAVHESCLVTGLPSWLDCSPLFRVDHWGSNAKFHPLERNGIRGERAAMLDAPIDKVSLTEYLKARYDPLPEPPPFKQKLKAIVKRWAPASIFRLLKRAAGAKPDEAPPLEDPERHHEMECARIFEEDLEYVLCLRDAGPEDLVFLPTANHREVLAIHRLIAKIGERRVPRFHLEFRHEIAERGNLANETRPAIRRETRFARLFFDAYKEYPATDRLRFWADTEELADDYRHLSGFPFGVLPIPFNHGLIEDQTQPGRPPLKCLYLGDVREEKGFHLLPDLIRDLSRTDCHSVLRFVIQATKPHPAALTPAISSAQRKLEGLESIDPDLVELVGRDVNFLPREQYFHMLGRSDIVLCLYDAKVYRARSSGIMAEALAAGKPVVVPAGTWMDHQLPTGCGEGFSDMPSLVDALRKIAVDYPRYRAQVQKQRAAWLARHSPRALLDCLTAVGLHQRQAA